MKRLTLNLAALYRKLRIKHKVFVLIALIMSVCFGITSLALQYAYGTYDEQLYAKSSQVLNLSSAGIENELKKIDRLSFNVATDYQVQELLVSLNRSVTEYERLQLRVELVDKLVQYAGYEPNLHSIELTDTLGNVYTAGQLNYPLEKRKRFIWETVQAGSGETRWIYPEETDPWLIAARDVRSTRNLELNSLGTLALRIKSDAIVESALQGTELRSGQFVIAAEGLRLYPNDGQPVQLPDSSGTGGRSGYQIEEVDGQQVFYTQLRSDYSGWVYYSLIPFEQIFERIIWMKQLLLTIFIVSLLVVFIIAVLFARGITRPIELLIDRMKLAQKGEFDYFALSDGELDRMEEWNLPQDEVGHLHRTFRIMMGQIQELITENYAKQIIIRDTQFKALQAQINPHFLYNTLESINWMAKINKQPRISQMVEALGFLLRSAIAMKDTLIPMREELEIVRNYITIQRFRFEERLVYECDIPEALLSCQIPKLTLQPLLENAIQYGLEAMIDPCRIRLTAVVQGDQLLLTVEDNGPGMSQDRLESVRRGDPSTRGSGIGLPNIQERISIAFGEGYGLHVDSAPGMGTRVELRLPYENGGYEHV